ncbi:double-stranded RNA-specific editase B2 isoform X1, partial [Tachysurus ichikawai]
MLYKAHYLCSALHGRSLMVKHGHHSFANPDFADAVFHLVREKYSELIGCSALMHACHKGLAGIVMTR